ncbi:Uncharacterized protein FWK35_00014173 [Aphis craccivora]|uniref:Uncharacterized protein n=1 Tax=Aphis craccivora TaxID=307492 RepID=A0A6G0YYF3_APHCR|nr:Uncharacterized protein FWK35_00014173 [Aphis craccivora]
MLRFSFVCVVSSRKFDLVNTSRNSERSKECIDFTMMCFVHWERHFLNFPIVFKSAKKKKKIKEKREFLRKTSFQPNQFFYMVVIQKLITTNT